MIEMQKEINEHLNTIKDTFDLNFNFRKIH